MQPSPIDAAWLRVLVAASCFFLSSPVFSQSSGCDGMEGFADFDFWLGKWRVFDSASGTELGSNLISKQESGCLVLEKWTSNSGGTGTSINYYNPNTLQWRQLWVSAGRYSIDIVGGLRADSMKLEGSIYYYGGDTAQFRGAWTPAEDGSVRQFFEQYDAESGAWVVWFDGRYEKTN